jgi:hypothetical protein
MAVTSAQVASRLLKYTQWTDFATLSDRERGWFVDAIQSAIQTWCMLVAPDLARVRGSAYLAGPQSVTIGVTQGSKAITGTIPSTHVGCTVRAAQWDIELESTSAFLTPWGGTTNASLSCTLYNDCFPLPEGVDSLVSDPVIQLQSGNTAILQQTPRILWKGSPRLVEDPKRCTLERINGAVYMRVDPMPSQPCVISYQYTAVAPVLTTNALLPGNAVDLPILDNHLELIILPLAAAELSKTQAWRVPETREQTLRDAQKAMALLETRVPQNTLNIRPSIKRGLVTRDYSSGTYI